MNVTEQIPYQVEAEDAVIRIEPRKRGGTVPLDPEEEARWKRLSEFRLRQLPNQTERHKDQELAGRYNEYIQSLTRKIRETERLNKLPLQGTRLFPRMEALLQSPPPPLDRSVVARRDRLLSAWGSVTGVSLLTDEEVSFIYGHGNWSLVAIDRGSDDALRAGQELFAYHEGKPGEYVSLGKFFLWRVDPDAAVGILLGTAKAPRVARGDLVTVKEIPAAEPDSKR